MEYVDNSVIAAFIIVFLGTLMGLWIAKNAGKAQSKKEVWWQKF